MKKEILKNYLEFSTYTYPGMYKEKLEKDLPNDIKEIGLLVRKNIIHRSTLAMWNVWTNKDLRFWDMKKVPWFRQPEDDIFTTAWAILIELYRRDPRGFTLDRKEEDKLVVTCRFISILMASILKSKWVPARVRSWSATYFTDDWISWDHWINEYYDKESDKWIIIDVDWSLSMNDSILNPYNLPKERFDFPAKAWLSIRERKENPLRFKNAKPEIWIITVLWSLFYDFHCLMNNEIIYVHLPKYWTYDWFQNITENELKRIDRLAKLMLEPENNFEELKELFNKKEFRLVYGWLI